jgi:malate dehydrogenase (oxaloacetate-decarboxylating)
MKFAAADAIASIVSEAELDPEYVIPSVFNPEVAPAVATATRTAAERAGVARKHQDGERATSREGAPG